MITANKIFNSLVLINIIKHLMQVPWPSKNVDHLTSRKLSKINYRELKNVTVH